MYIIQKTRKIAGRIKFLTVLILTFVAFAGSWNTAGAQTGNLSDWNVPPPLPPGNITKGNISGKGKKMVLTLTDVPAVSLPVGPPLQIPDLAAVSATAPSVASPGQPVLLGIEPGLPEIPLPAAPVAPALPRQSVRDMPIQRIIDIPAPPAPEMPALPSVPAFSGQTGAVKMSIPLMPDIVSLPSPVLPPDGAIISWAIPRIPETVTVKPPAAPKKKDAKAGRKRRHKAKFQPHKN